MKMFKVNVPETLERACYRDEYNGPRASNCLVARAVKSLLPKNWATTVGVIRVTVSNEEDKTYSWYFPEYVANNIMNFDCGYFVPEYMFQLELPDELFE